MPERVAIPVGDKRESDESRRATKRAMPDVHPDLSGFDVELNRFGEVDMTISIEELNRFLDREVDDPKLRQWGIEEEE